MHVPTDHPIHPLLADRHSPRAFADRDVPTDALRSVLEAARWAPSCFNDQPWSFLVATRADAAGHARIAEALVESNRSWAAAAPVLMVTVAREAFARNGRPNPHAWHDVGLAVAQLSAQATALGLALHQMAGIRRDYIAETFGLPEGHAPVTGIALGYPGDPDSLPAELAARERAPRVRRAQAEFVFGAGWGVAPSLPG